jgi:hypothetical protein
LVGRVFLGFGFLGLFHRCRSPTATAAFLPPVQIATSLHFHSHFPLFNAFKQTKSNLLNSCTTTPTICNNNDHGKILSYLYSTLFNTTATTTTTHHFFPVSATIGGVAYLSYISYYWMEFGAAD